MKNGDEYQEPLEGLENAYSKQSPSDLLESRTVKRLHEEGLLVKSQPRRTWKASWIVAAAAASIALFAAGVTTGQSMATRSVTEAFATAQNQSALDAAAAVQRAGTEYVRALVQFSQLSDSLADAGVLEQGREAGLTALYAAAEEFLKLAPEDPVSAGISAAFAVSQPGAGNQTTEPLQVIWF